MTHPHQENWEKNFDARISSMLWDYQEGKDTLKDFVRFTRADAVREERVKIAAQIPKQVWNVDPDEPTGKAYLDGFIACREQMKALLTDTKKCCKDCNSYYASDGNAEGCHFPQCPCHSRGLPK